MIVRAVDHHGKSLPLQEMLRELGHTVEEHPDEYDVLLIDSDEYEKTTNPGRMLSEAHRRGAKIVVYPHGAFPHRPSRATAFSAKRWAHGPGSGDLLQRYDHEVFDIGWYLCEKKKTKGKGTLFAGIHAEHGQDLSPRNHRLNTETLLDSGNCDIRVYDPGDVGLEDIDSHKTVVAAGSLAMVALARGKTVRMFGQQPCDDPYPNWGDRAIQRWTDDYVGEPITHDRLEEALAWL